MPKDCSDGKVGIALIAERRGQSVAEIVVADVFVARLALPKSALLILTTQSLQNAVAVDEGRERFKVSQHIPYPTFLPPESR